MAVIAAYMVPHPPIILPQIGRGEEHKINTTIEAYKRAARAIREHDPDVILISSPHSIMYSDYFHISPGNEAEGDFAQFRAKDVKIKVSYDTDFVNDLCSLAYLEGIEAGVLGERQKELDHGTMVPLYFIKEAYQDKELPKIVRIGLSGLPLEEHYRLGMAVKKVAEREGKKAVFVASGDLSHRLIEEGPYGYVKEGPEYDRRIMEVMEKADFGALFDFKETFCQKAGECGHRSFVIMAGALDGEAVEATKCSYEGPFGVGYGICMYEAHGKDKNREFYRIHKEKKEEEQKRIREREDAYVKLARAAVEQYAKTEEKISLPEHLPEELYQRRAGAFVSIKKDGRLRGCIGTIAPVRSCLGEEIIYNAISASAEDPRFEPIKDEELADLIISVDVLEEPEDIPSKESLDVRQYGVIVTKGYKRGLLLPNLEGIDTVDEQIEIAKKKAGIAQEEEVSLQRFKVVRHE